MQEELVKMRKELAEILSSDSKLKQALREVNKINMIRASLIARNKKHLSIDVGKILEGHLQRDMSVGDYVLIQNYCELIKAAYNNLEMGNSLNKNLLITAYRTLSENPEAKTRDDNPVVYSFNHVPPHAIDVDVQLAALINKVYSGQLRDDIAAKAMYIHNSIIDIWPFDEYNGEIAIFAMNYYLLEQGLMPIDMPIERQDYLDLTTECLKGRRLEEAYAFFQRAVLEKMRNTIEVCRGYVH